MVVEIPLETCCSLEKGMRDNQSVLRIPNTYNTNEFSASGWNRLNSSQLKNIGDDVGALINHVTLLLTYLSVNLTSMLKKEGANKQLLINTRQ